MPPTASRGHHQRRFHGTSRKSARELVSSLQISRRIITLARMLGWDVRWSGVSKQNVILRSDDGKRLVIPPTGVNVNRAQSWIRAILRHTAPAKIRNLYRGGTGINLAGP